MSRDAIHIVTAADAAYVPHVAAMLHSLFSRNPDEDFKVHFLHRSAMDSGPVARLAQLCERHRAQLADTPVERSLLEGLPVGGWYVEEAWYRVILMRVLADVRRALWLDADTIVRHPVRELWETELAGKSLAACPNAVLFHAAPSIERMGITDRRLYFNTGVLVLDLERMRMENAEAQLREAARQNRDWIHFADQDVLNCVYHQNYRRLPLAWNVLTHSYINVPETVRVHGREEYEEAMRAPRIVHFTGRTAKKPWSYACGHPYRGEYLSHRALAGWPPPEYRDRNVRNFLIRQIPLRWREMLTALKRRRYGEVKSYLRQW